jgi:hypothetical protein
LLSTSRKKQKHPSNKGVLLAGENTFYVFTKSPPELSLSTPETATAAVVFLVIIVTNNLILDGCHKSSRFWKEFAKP